MKKLFALALATVLSISGAKAGEPLEEFGIFNHVSVGAGVGVLDGIGFEVAAPITNYVQMRLGYSFMPKISYTAKDFEYEKSTDTKGNPTGEFDVKFKLNKGDFKFLFDVYPIKTSSFRVTLGAYIGREKLLKATSWDSDLKQAAPVSDLKPGEGLIIGDYTLGADLEDGIVRAAIHVKKFKPYIGLGFGRAVPKKRVGVAFDMGVMFWGTPGVYGRDVSSGEYIKIGKENAGDNATANKFFDILSKVKVCPVLSIRVNGRIF